MHLIRCFTASAMGGFKINGPPRVGKGPMVNEEDQELNNEASPSRPTQAGRIETCTGLISKAMKCLENNDKQCVIKILEELLKAECHNSYVVGKEIVDRVRMVAHELWLRSDDELRCKLLRILRGFVSKKWVRGALKMYNKDLNNKWRTKCGINWERGVARSNIVKMIEGLLREKFGWDEIRMCEELMRFIGVDTETFRKYGIEPCDWVHAGFDEVYFMGIALTDLLIEVVNNYVKALLGTSNAIDAVFFLTLLRYIREPSITIVWGNIEGTRIIEVRYAVYGKVDKWGWANYEELIKRIRALRPEDVPRLIAGAVDGDGSIRYDFNKSRPFIEIASCKACEKRIFLEVIQEALRKLGIEGKIYETDSDARLEVYGENAIELLRLITPHLRHPLKRLRAKLILMLRDGIIDDDTFAELYNQTKYEDGDNDPKRKHAIDALARAAPQTHTHGGSRYKSSVIYINELHKRWWEVERELKAY